MSNTRKRSKRRLAQVQPRTRATYWSNPGDPGTPEERAKLKTLREHATKNSARFVLYDQVQPGPNPYSPVAWTKATSRDFVPGMGQRVRLLRIAYGWTQKDLAERASIPVDKITALELERKRGSLSFKNVIRLAAALDTSLDFLAGATSDPTPRR
jgi:DNA-binding XRE family transcriptional regulator